MNSTLSLESILHLDNTSPPNSICIDDLNSRKCNFTLYRPLSIKLKLKIFTLSRLSRKTYVHPYQLDILKI